MNLTESYKNRLKKLAGLNPDDVKIDVPTDVTSMRDIFLKNGYKLFLVGGAIRDAILGKTPKDYDLATDASPKAVIRMLEKQPFVDNILETGKKFGIVNVITTDGEEYEIARFRKDIGSGRRPDEVEFTTIDKDVLRRDLTINALFYDLEKNKIIDLVGGVDDLKKGIIRTVGDATVRITEDRLRIMRAIRFATLFDSEIEQKLDLALKQDSRLGGFPVIKNADGTTTTENISEERIRDEFLKGIKSAQSVKNFLELVDKYDLFQWIFPNLKIGKLIEERIPTVLIAHLLKWNDPKKIKSTLLSSRYTKNRSDDPSSSKEIGRILFLIKLTELNIDNATKLKEEQNRYEVTPEEITAYAKHNNLDNNLISAFLKYDLSVTSTDFIDQGFQGAALGAAINNKEREVFKSLLS